MADLIPWLAPWSGRVLTLGVLLLGLVLAWRWGRGRRGDGPACPRCAYSRQGIAPGSPCPECGHALRKPGDAMGRRRRPWLAILALLLAVSLPGYTVYRRVSVWGWEYYTWVAPIYWVSPTMTIDSARTGAVEVRIRKDRRWWDDTHETVEIRDRGRLIDTWEEYRIRLRDPLFVPASASPVIVIETWSGGAHCCAVTDLVYEDGTRDSLNGGHNEVDFEDFDGDGVLDAQLFDWTFAYWRTSFADSPAPEVRLRWEGGRFVPSADLMRRPAPTVEDLAAIAEGYRNRVGGSRWTQSGVWSAMLDLIYTGHADLAWRFLDERWAGEAASSLAFREDFYAQLRQSPYFPVLVELNGDRLPPPLGTRGSEVDPTPRLDADP